MKRALAFVETTVREIEVRTAQLGERVRLDADVLDRSDSIALNTPGAISANGSCRLIEAQNGWIAANLPREDDLQSVPALLEREVGDAPWDAFIESARHFTCAELVARAEVLSLALAGVGETPAPPSPCLVEARPGARRTRRLRVVDFSALWAGPLCGSVFAAMGAQVVKIESRGRPDSTATSAPLLDQRLNGGKRRRSILLASPEARAELLGDIARADVLITSARARALEELGLTRDFLARVPGLIWIAITGHGFESTRVAFGDDAAASGDLVRWENDQPRFIGDAIADPLTGLAAANAALALLEQGQSGFVDAALARTSAYVAALRQ
jgi:hypothetical protein